MSGNPPPSNPTNPTNPVNPAAAGRGPGPVQVTRQNRPVNVVSPANAPSAKPNPAAAAQPSAPANQVPQNRSAPVTSASAPTVPPQAAAAPAKQEKSPPVNAAPEKESTPPSPPRTGKWIGGMLVMGAMTILSRVLGLVRDMEMAKLFGLSHVMDAFTVAFRIPNLSRKLFGEGALTTSFIPIFARELQHEDKSSAWILASAVLGWLALFLSCVVVLGEWGLAAWSWQAGVSAETQILIELTGLMLPYLVLICLACQVTAVLNSLGQFRLPAAVPVILNLVWLIGVWCVAPLDISREAKARTLGGCILLSGVLQLAVQWPALRATGFRFHWDWHTVRPQVKEILRTMLPVVFALSITQINTFLDSVIAWSFSHPAGQVDAVMPLPGSPQYPLAAGAVSALYYGERIYQFPLGVFGVALGAAIFPLLAQHAARNEMDHLREDLSLGLRLVLVIGVPASAALVWLANPIARCLFERGEFTPADALRTSQIIAAYGCGVWAYCALQILQRGCYAIGDRATPITQGLLSVFINLVLNLILIWFVAEQGLALSTSFCAMLQAAGIVWVMQRRLGRFDWPAFRSTALRTVIATSLMSAAGIGLIYWCQQESRLSGKLLGLLVPCAGASLTYVLSAWILKLDEFWIVFRKKN